MFLNSALKLVIKDLKYVQLDAESHTLFVSLLVAVCLTSGAAGFPQAGRWLLPDFEVSSCFLSSQHAVH